MISEIPLCCPHCIRKTIKSVDWVQQHTLFTCGVCGRPVMIDKDICAELLIRLERQQRH
jgi:hypothetical protein